MNKTERHNYARTLQRFAVESPIDNCFEIVTIIDSLHHLNSSLHRYNEIQCERELSEKEERRIESIEKKVKELCEKLGFNFRIQGDPRGPAIRFLLPSGRSNSWDGDSWIFDF